MGDVAVLASGAELLSQEQKRMLQAQALVTFANTAKSEGNFVNWSPCLGPSRPGREALILQLCHGAPGMLIGFAKLWQQMDDICQSIFPKAANLVWHAGPLKKPWGLCHGTAGNGYAFLKCYQLTGEELWLEKARHFAMHAIKQSKAMQEKYGCIRPDN